MARISDPFELPRPVYFGGFRPPSYLTDGQGKQINLRVIQEYPGIFRIRRWPLGLGGTVEIRAAISHDGDIRECAITYPSENRWMPFLNSLTSWTRDYVNQFKREVARQAELVRKPLLQPVPQ